MRIISGQSRVIISLTRKSWMILWLLIPGHPVISVFLQKRNPVKSASITTADRSILENISPGKSIETNCSLG